MAPPPPPHVAMVPFPFGSHDSTLLPLARALAAAAPAGTTISFLTTAGNIVQHRKAGAFPGNLRFVEVQDGMPSGGAGETPPLRRIEIFMAAAEAGGLREGLEAARDAAGGARVTCVVGDAFMCFAEEAAAAAGAPWVPVWNGSTSALLAHLHTDALREDVGDHAASRADDLLTSHPGLYRYRVRDLPDGIVSGDLKHVVNLVLERMARSLPRAGTTVGLNTIPGLDPPDVTAALAAVLPNGLSFGPYHLLPAANSLDTDPYDCLAWLDLHPVRTVVYISFGTFCSPRPDELPEVAAGLEASGAPFLWSLREESWPLLPPGFLEHAAAGAGLVVPWVPQVGVLRHASVGAFVTHAGWNSVLQSVLSGVPMACRPIFADHMMSARTVASMWGNGMMFEGLMTRGEVAHTVVMLLRGEEGRRVRARAQELQVLVAKAFETEGGCRKNFDKFVSIVCGV